MKFIHSSDWQIGMTRHFLEGEAQARFTQDRIDAITRLGELAKAHDAKFIVVAGDVFETNQLSRQTVVRTVEALNAIEVPVFLLPGNHDPLDATSIFHSEAFGQANEHIFVIENTAPIEVPGINDVEVVGNPWTSKRPTSDLVADLAHELAPVSRLRICVAHGQTSNLSPELKADTIDLATAEAAISDQKWHYLALGDRHSATDVGQTGAIWYSGAPEATDYDEIRPGFTLLVDIQSGKKPIVEELPVGNWRFITEDRHINSAEEVQGFEQWLSGLENKTRTIIKVSVTGTVNLASYAELERIMADYQDHFASLRWRERTMDLAILPDELDEDAVSLSGYAKQTWSDLIEAASDENDVEARDALALFYRLAQGGAHS